jgi:YD repeat-containing protein
MQFSCDVDQQLVQIVDQNNNILVRNTYDEFFRVIAQTNGRGFTTTFAYDAPGQSQTRITDPRGNSTIHTYDPQLRLIQVIDPFENTTTVDYDNDNNRIAITDKNGVVTRARRVF